MFSLTKNVRRFWKYSFPNFTWWLRDGLIDFGVFLERVRKKGQLLTILLIFIVISTAGYMLIEGWPMIDSLYMVIITMSTIGYGEVNNLSFWGRVFTIILIMTGVVIGSYAASATIETLTSSEFHQERRSSKRYRRLQRINQHTIVCGYGRLGRSLANELRERRVPFIVIDIDPNAVESCNKLGIPIIQGNAADEKILNEAGIERAKSLVTAAKSDAENVFIILSARGLREDVEIIARCNSEASISKLKRAGAHTVISPYDLAGRRIAHIITTPRITQFLDGILEIGAQQLRLEDFVIGEKSPLVGLTLKEAQLKVNVLAISRPDHGIVSHPNANTLLLPGVEIVVMGQDEELKQLAQLVKE
jgi:voltage-gated potassium channel